MIGCHGPRDLEKKEKGEGGGRKSCHINTSSEEVASAPDIILHHVSGIIVAKVVKWCKHHCCKSPTSADEDTESCKKTTKMYESN